MDFVIGCEHTEVEVDTDVHSNGVDENDLDCDHECEIEYVMINDDQFEPDDLDDFLAVAKHLNHDEELILAHFDHLGDWCPDSAENTHTYDSKDDVIDSYLELALDGVELNWVIESALDRDVIWKHLDQDGTYIEVDDGRIMEVIG